MNRTIWAILAVILLLVGLAAWFFGAFTRPAEPPPPAAVGEVAPRTEPAPTAIAQPVDEPEPTAVPPSFDVVRIEQDGSAVLAGRAEPGAEITVLDGDTVVGTVTADSRGEWVLVPDGALPPGARELRLSAAAPDGNTTESADTVVLVVPEPKRDIAGRRQDGTGGALAVLAPAEGAARVLQAPPADGAASGDGLLPAGEVVLDTVGYDREGRTTVGGRSAPGTEVMIYLDNTLVGRATADGEGRWELTPERRVEAGRYALRADQIDAEGKVSARAEVPFERRSIDGQALGDQAVVVLPGNNLWTIARRKLGGGDQYTMIFEANQTQIRDPDLIYPGQIFIVPAGQ